MFVYGAVKLREFRAGVSFRDVLHGFASSRNVRATHLRLSESKSTAAMMIEPLSVSW